MIQQYSIRCITIMLFCYVTYLLVTVIMSSRVSHLSLLACNLPNSRSPKPWGSCNKCNAAKPSEPAAASFRAAFLSVAITRFNLACFFFLLDFVPCKEKQKHRSKLINTCLHCNILAVKNHEIQSRKQQKSKTNPTLCIALYTSSFVGCTSTCLPFSSSSAAASSSSLSSSSPAAAAAS